MSKRVRAWGSLQARLVLVGEAPAKQEVRLGMPFVGKSGYELDRWWTPIHLSRRDFYIDNVFPYRAPNDDIDNVDHAEVEDWAVTLHSRLLRLHDPWVIVPTGNIALRTLMRRPLWQKHSPKITDWRGSLCQYTMDDGRTVKMIPTIHPAATFYKPSLARICRIDWRRIAAEQTTRTLDLPERNHLIHPIVQDDSDWLLDQADNPKRVMAIDIETNPETREILCVGFAIATDESFTFKWPDDRAIIKELCQSPCEKVLQNGHYDTFWLAEEGIRVRNWLWDTLAMHHALDSTMPHDLATMASVYTRQPFWKRDHKDEEVMSQLEIYGAEALYRYCGVDACVTLELFRTFLKAFHANA